MKVFQIFSGLVYKDYTPKFKTAEEASKHFAPNIVFVNAPDYVFEGWGFDETKQGNKRFIKPVGTNGAVYDENTGTFYYPGELIEEQIKGLKQQLSDNDYKIIKAYEYSLVGEEVEYDLPELHKEREELRNQINEKEKELEEIING